MYSVWEEDRPVIKHSLAFPEEHYCCACIEFFVIRKTEDHLISEKHLLNILAGS